MLQYDFCQRNYIHHRCVLEKAGEPVFHRYERAPAPLPASDVDRAKRPALNSIWTSPVVGLVRVRKWQHQSLEGRLKTLVSALFVQTSTKTPWSAVPGLLEELTKQSRDTYRNVKF